MILKRLQDKQQAAQKKPEEPKEQVKADPSASQIYLTSIQQLAR
jgi:hypothetical protein